MILCGAALLSGVLAQGVERSFELPEVLEPSILLHVVKLVGIFLQVVELALRMRRRSDFLRALLGEESPSPHFVTSQTPKVPVRLERGYVA